MKDEKKILEELAFAYFNLGCKLFQMQRYMEALENFQKTVDLAPDKPEYHNLLGQTYDNLGQTLEAEKSLRHAIEINPNYAVGYYDLGVILAKREGLKQEALATFERALKNDPDLAEAYYATACLHALSGKEGPALEFLEKALRKGFRDLVYIERDTDWDGLRTNPQYARLLQKYCDTEEHG
ncbi:MAG: tetratricopeptide repeat protein [Deltaproteobacteria bacterium]